MGERPKWSRGDYYGLNEAEKQKNMDSPVVVNVCKNHKNVVVDVRFRGKHVDEDVIQEQFEFELVGSRIFVRPVAADHPQGNSRWQPGSGYPRKRPASPYNESRSYPRSRSPSPKSRPRRERQKVRRHVDRYTSPGPHRGAPSQDSYESIPSYGSATGPQPCVTKDNSMWDISKREYDKNDSLGSGNSLGNVQCGAIEYCIKLGSSNNYRQRNKPISKQRPTISYFDYDNDNDLYNDPNLIRQHEKYLQQREHRCRPCCSNENPRGKVTYEEYEMVSNVENVKAARGNEDGEEKSQEFNSSMSLKLSTKNRKVEPEQKKTHQNALGSKSKKQPAPISKSKSNSSLYGVQMKPKHRH